MSTVRAGRPTIVSDHQPSTPLDPVPLGGNDKTEDWLQELLDTQPEILPVDEIGAAYGPLISLGRELELAVGFVDNLFVSPTGELTIVEAKLWRNPEARRKVVGQILDYAAELANLSYEDLDQIVRDADPARRSIWGRVSDSTHPPLPETEHRFVDVVSRNLRAGRFLLLVVGDGIRSNLMSLAELLASHPGLAFHLELVELRLFRMPEGDSLLVVPTLVGRSVESVARTVIEVRSNGPVDVDISVDVTDKAAEESRKFASTADFLAAFETATSPARARAVGALVDWWTGTLHGRVKFGKTSMNLSVPHDYKPGGGVSVMTIYADGWVQGTIAPMVEWREIISFDEAWSHYEAAGFVAGDPMWPRLDELDLTQPDQRERFERLLTWADEMIRSSSNSDTAGAT